MEITHDCAVGSLTAPLLPTFALSIDYAPLASLRKTRKLPFYFMDIGFKHDRYRVLPRKGEVHVGIDRKGRDEQRNDKRQKTLRYRFSDREPIERSPGSFSHKLPREPEK